jgi:multiple sugar transport system permease protein
MVQGPLVGSGNGNPGGRVLPINARAQEGPNEPEEAAWVDGATPFVSFVRILLPLAAPGIGVVATLTFLGAWSNFYVPFILLETQGEMPATVTIYSFFSQYGNVLYGQLAAFSLLYSLPTVVLYFISRRSFGQSLTLGGVKG